MAKVEIKKEWLTRAQNRAALEPEERERLHELLRTESSSLDIEAIELPNALWRAMLDDTKLSAKARTALALHLFGMKQDAIVLDSIYATVVESPAELGSSL